MSNKALTAEEIINLFTKNELPTILDKFFKAKALKELTEDNEWELAKEYANDIMADLNSYDWRGGEHGQCPAFGKVEEWIKTDVEAELDLDVLFDEDIHAESCAEMGADEVGYYCWALAGAARIEEFALANAVEKWLEALPAGERPQSASDCADKGQAVKYEINTLEELKTSATTPAKQALEDYAEEGMEDSFDAEISEYLELHVNPDDSRLGSPKNYTAPIETSIKEVNPRLIVGLVGSEDLAKGKEYCVGKVLYASLEVADFEQLRPVYDALKAEYNED